MVDIPERTESHGPVFIYGVEGEQIEEENDAYNDLRYDIGERQEARGERTVAWIGNQSALHDDLSLCCIREQQSTVCKQRID